MGLTFRADPIDAQRAELRLRSGRKALGPAVTSAFIDYVRGSAAGAHGFVVFRRNPHPEELASLSRLGLVTQRFLTNTTYLLFARRNAAFADSTVKSLVAFLARAEPVDRVAPGIWDRRFWRVPGREADSAGLTMNADSTMNVVIRFHVETTPAEVQRVMREFGRRASENGADRWRATLSHQEIVRLARQESILWIDAAPARMRSDMDRARAVVHLTDEIQSFNTGTGVAAGLTGAGVRVAMHEEKGIDGSNPDFNTLTGLASRIVSNQLTVNWHATATAGVLGGSGSQSDKPDSWSILNGGSAFQWRGIAPAVELINLGWLQRVAASLDEYRKSIEIHGAAFSNHSYSMTYDGEYDEHHQTHDAAIRGDDPGDGTAIASRLHVHSAGNYGTYPHRLPKIAQRGYFSIGNQLKNALTVGNFYVDDNRLSRRSSLGPAHDGRIKPDVIAPGAILWAPSYCDGVNEFNPSYLVEGAVVSACDGMTAPTVDRRNFYFPAEGSSIAAAITSGVVALVVEKLRTITTELLNVQAPLASTLRAVMIHSAADVTAQPDWLETNDGVDGTLPIKAFPGPDFATGFGMIDAAAAVATVQSGGVLENRLPADCASHRYKLFVPPGSVDNIKVTLAWDDPASASPQLDYTESLLVNDLDLVLIDPNGVRHYPWRLDQSPVDGAGLAYPDSAQTCGSYVLMNRRLHPTSTPYWPGYTPPDVINGTPQDDSINDADIVGADTGKDHLNNIEQVVAAPVEGIWVVEVSAYRLSGGLQKYSLVGFTPLQLMPELPSTGGCRLRPVFCEVRLAQLCVRYPKICQGRKPLPFADRAMRMTFEHRFDRKVIEVARLCFLMPDCGGTQRPDQPLGLSFPTNMEALGLEVFDARGRLVARDLTTAPSKRLTIPARTGPTLMVIRPLDGIRLGTEYNMPVMLNRTP